MRFASVLAALAALWVQPVAAATIYTGFIPAGAGSVGTLDGPGEWATVRFSQALASFSGKASWFIGLGASYCDETKTSECMNPLADANGFWNLDQIDAVTYRVHYTRPIAEGWFAGTYVMGGAFQGSGLGFDYSHAYENPVRYTVIFSDGIPEPSTWALLMLGIGAIGVGLRRRRAHQLVDQLPPVPALMPSLAWPSTRALP